MSHFTPFRSAVSPDGGTDYFNLELTPNPNPNPRPNPEKGLTAVLTGLKGY